MGDPEWRIFPKAPQGFDLSLGVTAVQAQLLFNRGISDTQHAANFLAADERLLFDYSLLPDIDLAVKRINQALSSDEPIGIYGDFDTDGISGTALLVHAFRLLGGKLITYIPDRMDEGHGLNTSAIDSLAEQGVSLLITVDCGVGAVYEVAYAGSLGIDTIITDHHSPTTDIPSSVPVVNPSRLDSRYPSNDLTGAGIAYKLAQAVWDIHGRAIPSQLLELAALGTVADIAPMLGENRYIVGQGIKEINNSNLPGIKALIEVSGYASKTITAQSLAFGLIPRLNAAGRLGDASLSLDLLLSTSYEVAKPISEALDEKNFIRRQLTEEALTQAKSQTNYQVGAVPSIIIVEDERWSPGILGLVAARIAEIFHRPAIAITTSKGESRASARSIQEFDIVKAIDQCASMLHRYGGHPMAAGFSLSSEELPSLKSRLEEIADKEFRSKKILPTIDIDAEVVPTLLLGENLRFIETLQPFGAGNPEPLFVTRNLNIVEVRTVGRDRNHLKMLISYMDTLWDAIAFGHGDTDIIPGDVVDLVYSVEMNEWKGRKSPQMKVVGIKPHRSM